MTGVIISLLWELLVALGWIGLGLLLVTLVLGLLILGLVGIFSIGFRSGMGDES